VLGYLRNQRLVKDVTDIDSITVDWDVGAAAVKTRHGIEDIEEKTSRRVVTTGCGQGSVFGGLMDEVDEIVLPADAQMTQAQLYSLVNTIRLKETTYKSAGSVHACALFAMTAGDPEMLLFVEDVGRHNAIDTIAGWMSMQNRSSRARSEQSLLHHRPPHQRNGHQVRPDGRAHCGFAQRHHADGAPGRADRRPVRHRPRHQQALCLLCQPAAAQAAARAGGRQAGAFLFIILHRTMTDTGISSIDDQPTLPGPAIEQEGAATPASRLSLLAMVC
jgi:hypothetical protein